MVVFHFPNTKWVTRYCDYHKKCQNSFPTIRTQTLLSRPRNSEREIVQRSANSNGRDWPSESLILHRNLSIVTNDSSNYSLAAVSRYHSEYSFVSSGKVKNNAEDYMGLWRSEDPDIFWMLGDYSRLLNEDRRTYGAVSSTRVRKWLLHFTKDVSFGNDTKGRESFSEFHSIRIMMFKWRKLKEMNFVVYSDFSYILYCY